MLVDANLRSLVMKRVLMVVLVVQVVTFVSGCKKRTDEPSGAGSPGPAAVKPAVIEQQEPIKPDLQRGLVGWWRFDETSGTTAADSSGHGREGMLKGGLSFDSNSVEGRAGKALELGSEADSVVIKGYKGITGTQARSVAAWIKTGRDGGQILSWGKDEGGGMFIFGFVRGRVGVTPQGGYLYMQDRLNDNTWHHAAAVVEEAELPNLHDHVKIYKDGEVAIIHDIGILDLWPIDTASDLDVTIGKGFEGAVDDVRIYDRALSAEEVELLFKSAGQ
jgi:hypothetical protein